MRGEVRRLLLLRKYVCPAFLLALTLHFLWSILFIFCVLAPRGMNKIGYIEISHNLPSPSPSLSQILLAFIPFESQTQKKESPGPLILYLSKSEKRKKII